MSHKVKDKSLGLKVSLGKTTEEFSIDLAVFGITEFHVSVKMISSLSDFE